MTLRHSMASLRSTLGAALGPTLRAALVATIALGAASTLLGCSSPQGSTGVGNPGLTSEEQALVDDGSDGQQSGDTASALVAVPFFAVTRPAEIATPDIAATTATLSKDWFRPATPSSCVDAAKTTTGTGATVTYTFTAPCSGPLGLASIEGKIVVEFAAGATGGIDIKAHSEGLSLDKVPVTETLSGNVAFSGATRTIVWNGEFDGTTPRGHPVVHTASYSVVEDLSAGCVQIDGSAQTTLVRDGATFGHKSDVAGYVHCGPRAACPSGGTVVYSRLPDGKPKVTVRFLGGRRAEITTPRGKVVDFLLKCG